MPIIGRRAPCPVLLEPENIFPAIDATLMVGADGRKQEVNKVVLLPTIWESQGCQYGALKIERQGITIGEVLTDAFRG